MNYRHFCLLRKTRYGGNALGNARLVSAYTCQTHVAVCDTMITSKRKEASVEYRVQDPLFAIKGVYIQSRCYAKKLRTATDLKRELEQKRKEEMEKRMHLREQQKQAELAKDGESRHHYTARIEARQDVRQFYVELVKR